MLPTTMGGYSGNSADVVHDLPTCQQDTITRIVGDITPKTLDILEEEIGGILVSVKLNHYAQGAKYGHLAAILGETRMRKILNNQPNYGYDTPVDQGAYDPVVIANAAMATRIVGDITPKTLDILEEEIGGILVSVKLNHCPRKSPTSYPLLPCFPNQGDFIV